MATYSTLLLDQTAWDLVLDSGANIAKADPPYALAQDVASACRLFLGELWYDQAAGIPYFSDVLGQIPPASLFTGLIEQQALTVPGVVNAQCVITSFTGRTLSGQVQFTDENGTVTTITI